MPRRISVDVMSLSIQAIVTRDEVGIEVVIVSAFSSHPLTSALPEPSYSEWLGRLGSRDKRAVEQQVLAQAQPFTRLGNR